METGLSQSSPGVLEGVLVSGAGKMPLTVVEEKLLCACSLLIWCVGEKSSRWELFTWLSSEPMLWEGQEGGSSFQGKNFRKPKLARKERKLPEHLLSA